MLLTSSIQTPPPSSYHTWLQDECFESHCPTPVTLLIISATHSSGLQQCKGTHLGGGRYLEESLPAGREEASRADAVMGQEQHTRPEGRSCVDRAAVRAVASGEPSRTPWNKLAQRELG